MVCVNRFHFAAGQLLVAMALVVVATGAAACAQDLLVVPDQNDVPGAAPRVILGDFDIDRFVFGGKGADEGRRRAELRLQQDVNDVDRMCGLTEAQRKKLTLAGSGDIKRYFDRVDELKRTLRGRPIDTVELGTVNLELQRASLYSGPYLFGDKSLFAKSIENTLTPEQFDRYRRFMRAELLARHRTTIKSLVDRMHSMLRLSSEQDRRFEDLLLKETRPPPQYGRYDDYGVLFQLSKLDTAKLRPIFDDDQWGKLTGQFARAAKLERILRVGGYLPDDPAAEGATGAGEQPLAAQAKP
jgi:hypothetical protein